MCKMENIYYVYLHTRLDTGSVFYVGKGQSGRAWLKSRTNSHWLSIVAKTEYVVSIVQDGMTEVDAHLLEMWLIAKLRHAGVKLANKTDGGEGVSGFKWSEAQRAKHSKKVYCSNGMSFSSIALAADWVRGEGTETANGGMISACCLGRYKSVYGHAWSHESVPDKPIRTGKEAMSKAASDASSISVICSNGMVFASRRAAVVWLRSNGYPKASDSAIVACCKGRYHSAYGHTWRMEGDERKPLMTKGERISLAQGIPVKCSNGMVFHSMSTAARWLRANGSPKADGVNIKKHLDGKIKTCYGYTWSYAE